MMILVGVCNAQAAGLWPPISGDLLHCYWDENGANNPINYPAATGYEQCVANGKLFWTANWKNNPGSPPLYLCQTVDHWAAASNPPAIEFDFYLSGSSLCGSITNFSSTSIGYTITNTPPVCPAGSSSSGTDAYGFPECGCPVGMEYYETLSKCVPIPNVITPAGTYIPPAGSWAPTLQFGGGSTGLVATATGHYSITNGYVEGDYEVSISAKGSSTGTVTLGGLPYPADNINAANAGGGPINSYSGFTALPGVPWMYVDTSNVLHMVYGNATGFVSLSSSVLTNTSAFRGTFKYKIAQ